MIEQLLLFSILNVVIRSGYILFNYPKFTYKTVRRYLKKIIVLFVF